MINHVTYHLTPNGLKSIGSLMEALGFKEVEPDDPFEHGYMVRWFTNQDKWRTQPLIHFVASDTPAPGRDQLALGHFCVVVSPARYDLLGTSRWCVRNSGSGRIWLEHDAIRVEVRPSSQPQVRPS